MVGRKGEPGPDEQGEAGREIPFQAAARVAIVFPFLAERAMQLPCILVSVRRQIQAARIARGLHLTGGHWPHGCGFTGHPIQTSSGTERCIQAARCGGFFPHEF